MNKLDLTDNQLAHLGALLAVDIQKTENLDEAMMSSEVLVKVLAAIKRAHVRECHHD